MSIGATCGCGKKYALADALAGKKVKCKECGAVFVVPAKADTVSDAPAVSPTPGGKAPATVSQKPLAPPAPNPAAPSAPATPKPAMNVPSPQFAPKADEPEIIGLAPEEDEADHTAGKLTAVKPATTNAGSTSHLSTKATNTAPPSQPAKPAAVETPKPPQPAKLDAAWDSLLNQQDSALKDAEVKQAEAAAKRAEVARRAERMRRQDEERQAQAVAKKARAAESEGSESASRGFILDWASEPFDRLLSIPVAFVLAFTIVGAVALANPGAALPASKIFLVIGIITGIIARFRFIAVVFEISTFRGVMLFVPMLGRIIEITSFLFYRKELRGPFINSLIAVALVIGAFLGGLAGLLVRDLIK